MRKNILVTHNRTSELESRLNKHSYLSKKGVPGASDAKMYEMLRNTSQLPDRKLYPNIYHWFILIRQFSDAARAKWISNGTEQQQTEDGLITELLQEQQSSKLKGVIKNRYQIAEPTELHKWEVDLTPHSPTIILTREDPLETEFFLNVLSKEDITDRLQELAATSEKDKEECIGIEIMQIKIEESADGKNFSICFKATPKQCEQLKDVVSHWPEIMSFHIKKQKKSTFRQTRVTH